MGPRAHFPLGFRVSDRDIYKVILKTLAICAVVAVVLYLFDFNAAKILRFVFSVLTSLVK